MNPATHRAIKAILATDADVAPEQRDAALAILTGRTPQDGPPPLLLTQMQAAHLLSVSRYTVWRMTREGALHPVNVRGSFRYRRAEIEAIANGPVPADDPKHRPAPGENG